MSRRVLRIVLTLGMLLATFTWAALPAQAAGTVLFCPADQSGLEAAIGAAGPGGTMLFSCDTSITLTSTIALADVTLDGNGFDVTIDGNHAVRIFNVSGTVSLTGLHLTNGYPGSFQNGGAISTAYGSVLTVTNSVLDGNSSDVYGAGMYADNSTVTIANSTLRDNMGQYGGAIYAGSSTMTITGSTLSDNTAFNGAAIDFRDGSVTLINSTVAGNSANAGGAIAAIGDVTLLNSTFYGNQAAWGYGGGYMYGNSLYFPSGSTFTMTNTIMVSSTKGECAIDSSNGINRIDGGGNLLTDDSCATNDSHADPIGTQVSLADLDFATLADNGGPTQTMALGENSVAIGAGVLAACSAAPINSLDQRGYTRPTTTCDSGAYDSGATAPDTTAPVITPTVNGTLGSNGWYTSDVDVSWNVVDDESTISASTGCDATTVVADTTGTIFTCEATSAGGTASQSITIQRDATAPSVSITGIADGTVYTLGDTIPAVGCTTDDAMSGVATQATATTSGGSVGEMTVTCSGATDNAGNTASASISYAVHYDWEGFKGVVKNQPKETSWIALLPVPVMFTIDGNQGPDAISSITSRSCSNAPGDGEVSAGSLFDIGVVSLGRSDQYLFIWTTPRSWAGTCRVLTVTLADGTSHEATFNFR